MTNPIELWYWPTPNGWKVSIALEEMGLPYELKPVNIGVGEQFEPAFQAISPNGRMPAIVDPDGPDGQPLSIFEIRAILQYLGSKSGPVLSDRTRAARPRSISGCSGRSAAWGRWPARPTISASTRRPSSRTSARSPMASAATPTRRTGCTACWTAGWRTGDYLAGDYSIADMAAWPWILPEHQGQDLDEFPNLAAWMTRVGVASRVSWRAGRSAKRCAATSRRRARRLRPREKCCSASARNPLRRRKQDVYELFHRSEQRRRVFISPLLKRLFGALAVNFNFKPRVFDRVSKGGSRTDAAIAEDTSDERARNRA